MTNEATALRPCSNCGDSCEFQYGTADGGRQARQWRRIRRCCRAVANRKPAAGVCGAFRFSRIFSRILCLGGPVSPGMV